MTKINADLIGNQARPRKGWPQDREAAGHRKRHQLAPDSMPYFGDPTMRTTVNIDDELLAKATKLAGRMNRSLLLSEALRALIEREGVRQLARLGGSQPKLEAAPRRRQRSAS